MTATIKLQPSYRYPNEDISWAGECTWTGGICFGTDDGNLLLPAYDGAKPQSWLINRDTVNGMAFGTQFAVASSPTEVTWLPRGGELHVLYAGGAHDVVALTPTLFLAPLGPHGILSLMRDSDRWRVGIGTAKGEQTFIYRLCPLHPQTGRHLVAGAGRTKGLVLYECDSLGGDFTLSFRDLPDYDLVDVCHLHSPNHPCAVAALASDRTLFVTPDIRKVVPIQLTVSDLEGTGYTLKALGSHLIVLTSRALYILENFIEKFAKGELQAPSKSPVYTLPVEASEVYVAYDEYLLLEADDAIHALRIKELLDSAAQSNSERPTVFKAGQFAGEGYGSTPFATGGSTLSESEVMPAAVNALESPVRHLDLATSLC
jgi:hypothetical protein